MCGIAGFCDPQADRRTLIGRMTDRIQHRGPDAEGCWLDDRSGWVLGHRRLSILDLSEAGAQPMLSASGRFVISYNGEIYNARVLRGRLLKEHRVAAFRGTSDTEVLLEAIEAYGLEETLKLSKGMFALAVYDRQERVLRLARDRAGEKPLYFGMLPGPNGPYFAFASDCACLRCLPGFTPRIDREALAAYMLYKFVPGPLSIYEGIRKLAPGSILTLAEPFDQPRIQTYWSMIDTAVNGRQHLFTGTYEEAREQLEQLLTDSIRDQMVADVPVGAFLSGGVDSPTVVSLMQKLSHRPVKTFTIGYDDPSVNESEFAKEIARHLGTEHTELRLTEKEMQALIPELPRYFTEPLGDSSVISTFFVSRLAREKVTVSLSGDAGDELLCGYERYWNSDTLWRRMDRIPRPLRQTAGRLLAASPWRDSPPVFKAAGCLSADNPNQIREMLQYRRLQETSSLVIGAAPRPLSEVPARLEDPVSAMLLGDLEDYFPDDILYKVDRASMAVSLESRIPLLDRDVVEFIWTLPTDFKYAGGVSKRILRDILYRYVPREMLDRPKQGFWVPIKKWLLEGSTFAYTNELLTHSLLVRDGYLDGKAVDGVWQSFQQNPRTAQVVFNILMAEQWYRSTMPGAV